MKNLKRVAAIRRDRVLFFNMIKNAVSKQSIINLGYPEIFYSFFTDRFKKNAYIIAKWFKDIGEANASFLNEKPFYFTFVKSFNRQYNAVMELSMYLAIEDALKEVNDIDKINKYSEFLRDYGFEDDSDNPQDINALELEKMLLEDQIIRALNGGSVLYTEDLIKAIDSGSLKNISKYKKLNYYEASKKYIEDNFIVNEDNVVRVYEDGYRWVDFNKTCRWLGEKMKNCGSSGFGASGFKHKMIALLDGNDKPHIVLTHSEDVDLISNVEGIARTASKGKYHDYILDLINYLGADLEPRGKSKELQIKYTLRDYDVKLELLYKDTFEEIYILKVNNMIFYTDFYSFLDEESTKKVYEYINSKAEEKKSLIETLPEIFPSRKPDKKRIEEEVGVKFYYPTNSDLGFEIFESKFLKKESRINKIISIHKKAFIPYEENNGIRKFSASIDDEELIWHRDNEDRKISVLSSGNWMLQFDNKLPIKLEVGKDYLIKKNSWHRILKGNKDLILKIKKMSSDKGMYSEKEQRDILLRNAKSHFGLTRYIEQAGYLLEDGTMLDFSGGSFDRVHDHREIEVAFDGKYEKFITNYDNETSRTDIMNHFMRKTQSIRLMLYDDGIGFDIETDITEDQKHMIEQIVRDVRRFKKLDWIQVMKSGEKNRFYNSYEVSEAKRYMSGESLFSNKDSFEEMIDKIHSCEEKDLEDLSRIHDVKINNIGNDAYELDFSNSYFKFEFKNNKNYSNSKIPHILIFENGDLTSIEDWIDYNEEYLDDYNLDEKYDSFLSN